MNSQKLATLKSSTRWEATLAKIRQALKTNYTKELVTTSLRKSNGKSEVIIPPCRGMNQSQYEYQSITGRIPKGKRQPIFFRGSHACRHTTSPLCRLTLGGLVTKRCCTNLVHIIGHHKNLSISEVTQWHTQSTRVAFGALPRKAQKPLTITGRSKGRDGGLEGVNSPF
jgi:hypothetical protein